MDATQTGRQRRQWKSLIGKYFSAVAGRLLHAVQNKANSNNNNNEKGQKRTMGVAR